MTTTATSRADRLLGSPPVTRLSDIVTARRLRIPAYHGVPHPRAFRTQLEALARRYRPVSGAQVAAAVAGGTPLPRRAMWVTFDDGRADVVEAGMPELDHLGIPATMFICPGLVLDRRPFWWDQVTAALADAPYDYDGRTWTDRRLVTHLKGIDDDERRRVVDELADRSGTPEALADSVLTVDQVRAWTAAGHEIGNHTWDHPCLDRCDEAVQATQVGRAHDAITELLGTPPDLFAYPNGDWAPAAEQVLRDAGYRVGLLFDHRLTDTGGSALRLSRLRLDSDAPLARAAAIMSGGHSAVFAAKQRLTRLRGGRHG